MSESRRGRIISPPSFAPEMLVQMRGSDVYSVPALGQELIIRTPSGNFYNLGFVTLVQYEDGSGRNFIVQTHKIRQRFMVILAEGIATPFHLTEKL